MTKPANNSATILFVRGIPGSGKSYLSQRLAEMATNTPVVILDPDAVTKTDPAYSDFSDALSAQGLPESIHIFRWLRAQAITGLSSGSLVIWSQPFTQAGVFNRLIEFLKTEMTKLDTELRVVIAELSVPRDIAYSRIQDRLQSGGHGPSEPTFNKRVSEYASFADVYDVVELNGSADVDELADTINAKLRR